MSFGSQQPTNQPANGLSTDIQLDDVWRARFETFAYDVPFPSLGGEFRQSFDFALKSPG